MTFKRVAFFLLILIIIPIISYFVIRFIRGERLDPQTKLLSPTGLLVASSIPEGASVFVDGKLKTATDDTLNLVPGSYEVEIKKDGFHSWKKTLRIEKELVTRADTYLFSSFPSLNSLTYTGAANPSISPDSQKIVFSVASASASKQGLWVLDLAPRPFGMNREPRQIIANPSDSRDFSDSSYTWSPDSKQVLVNLNKTKQYYLLDSDRLNLANELVDVASNLETILAQWEKEKNIRKEAQLSKLPKELLEVLTDSTDEIIFSPDEKKIMYTATASATIPDEIVSPLPASNTQPENRNIEPGKVYVYDLIEDKNFYLIDSKDIPSFQPNAKPTGKANTVVAAVEFKRPSSLAWFPTSSHLFLVQPNKVTIMEYDNTNLVDVYTGPFENGFAFPFPSGDKILILASLGENQPPNLYAVGLR